MIKLVSHLLFFTAMVCVANGCGSKLPSEQDSIVAAGQPQIWIEPVRTNVGVTGRSVLHCSAGECIILHYPPTFVDIKNLDEALKFNPDSLDDDGECILMLAAAGQPPTDPISQLIRLTVAHLLSGMSWD